MTGLPALLPDAGDVVAVIATTDTKGEEAEHVCSLLRSLGVRPWLIDTGVLNNPTVDADVRREHIARLGGGDLEQLRDSRDPGAAMSIMAAGTARALEALEAAGQLRSVIGITGGKGAAAFAEATANLPMPTLKILVASARADVLAQIASVSTTVIFPTLVDLMGLNPVTRLALGRAVTLAISPQPDKRVAEDSKTVAVTSFGVTTAAAMACVVDLRRRGLETLVFPANGGGGRLLERLIAEGSVDGLIDITTTELADELVGGTASAGPDRLRAAGRVGIPHWVAPGATDMVNFGPPDTIPAQFSHRTFYRHSQYTTLMRTNASESHQIGRITAERLSAGAGPRLVCWTGGGFSDYDRPGGQFYDPVADGAWLEGLRAGLSGHVEVVEVNDHINDPAVASAAAAWMADQLETTGVNGAA